MRARKREDADWRGGRTWSLVYPAGEDVDAVLRAANELYVYENALNPFRFPSLANMEKEICGMTRDLLHAPEEAGGTLTSGGT
ncbi:MAG TPA: aspartate aminotransferase family protein, partial [Deltaproteobacteria bacterium]|nr:aspartate aminotransferase family protein [Deltaproteobacteria bacterium]